MMGAEKVFFIFGLNDIGMEAWMAPMRIHLTVIEKIQESKSRCLHLRDPVRLIYADGQ